MRIQLPESDRRRQPRTGAMVASIALHAVLILLIAHQTVRGDPPLAEPSPPHIVYHMPPSLPTVPDGRHAPNAPADDQRPDPAPRSPIVPPIDVPTGIPDVVDGILAPDLPITIASGTFAGTPLRDRAGGRRGGGAGDTPLPEALVERPVRLLSGAPRYPAMQQSRGEEGYVLARFVVDTTGRVEPASVEIVESTDVAFGDAVRDALRRMRFAAAEAGGRRVRQLVEQRFEFRLQ